ncbi:MULTISPECIES: GerAB/ArcD/ProY family transporter [unclassified Paenibacillus]|uniref:GerAB/ArcD/ProY family transporter n=1 Tax=unclassified Paenibacillus TaxID=185978 RepID=UPI002406A68D|nr:MULTISPECIES: GerAB/ArcD/ProY family transporter [unclassified Paenibacillus]MDF9840403.1 spore germination protein KB [Paenibacillus sp. PastF-2]MDF9846985.1 spore germination protein KB [Paenibacillus sp. PastM-2]MDF9853557.1 spore germination protein KB [Paenibacillus sp. PastF-1]MDH6478957.1 spore germination protein KB [Paenibacillus sp. PastH-2]MDH6506689.1 spore germination protein KB [Paenibacillus sp. PastM-3]
MRKEVIGPFQLFAMIVLFELGTAVVVPIGLESGHSVWISILVALPGGILLFMLYAYLYRQFPDLVISGYTRKILGKWIGWPLSLLYLPVLTYNGGRNLREAGDLLISSSYDRTPIFIINSIMIIAVMYILYQGIEVFSRTSEIYFWLIVIMGMISNFVVIIAGLVQFKNLFPVHPGEWVEVYKSAYPNIWIFPYGELVCFTAVLPHFKARNKVGRTGAGAITLSALLLSITHAIEMSVLGPDIYSRTTFPMFTTISLVNVANFLQRLDALVILTLIIGVFFKMSIYCYAAVSITADLFHVKEPRKLVIPVGSVVLFSSFVSAENYPVHMNDGKVFLENILPFLCAVIPILLFVVHRVRRRFGWYR